MSCKPWCVLPARHDGWCKWTADEKAARAVYDSVRRDIDAGLLKMAPQMGIGTMLATDFPGDGGVTLTNASNPADPSWPKVTINELAARVDEFWLARVDEFWRQHWGEEPVPWPSATDMGVTFRREFMGQWAPLRDKGAPRPSAATALEANAQLPCWCDARCGSCSLCSQQTAEPGARSSVPMQMPCSCGGTVEVRSDRDRGKSCEACRNPKPPTLREWLGPRVAELGEWAGVLREQPVPAGFVTAWAWRTDNCGDRCLQSTQRWHHYNSSHLVPVTRGDVVWCMKARGVTAEAFQMALFTRHPRVKPEPKPARIACEDQYEVMP
jgi:hypothetical protein